MKTLQEVNEEIAKENGFKDWSEALDICWIENNLATLYSHAAERYAKTAYNEALEDVCLRLKALPACTKESILTLKKL
jgi:hypothetical protein